MNKFSKFPAVIILSIVGAHVFAVDLSKKIAHDALRMVACIKALDAPCAQSLTYTKFLEEQGSSRAQLDQKVTDVYQRLRSIGATYSSFDLAWSWQPFSLDKRTYAFIPYSYTLLARGEMTQVQAFL